MVRTAHRQAVAPRHSHQRAGAGKRHPRLDHNVEREPKTLRLDQNRRRDTRTPRHISTAHSWRGTLAVRSPRITLSDLDRASGGLILDESHRLIEWCPRVTDVAHCGVLVPDRHATEQDELVRG